MENNEKQNGNTERKTENGMETLTAFLEAH